MIGLIGNIYALLWLWTTLKDEYKCSHLCTNPLCQDCLENFFAEIRRRCGFNDAPNAFQFGSAFKYAMVAAAEENSFDGKNCQNDKAVPLLNDNDLDQFPVPEQDDFSDYEFEPLDYSIPLTAQKKELNALVYVLGAAAGKLRHKKCREKLIEQRDGNFLENEDYSFTLLKSSISSRSVHIPNNALYAVGLVALWCFKLKFRKFLYENRCGVKKRLKAYVQYTSLDFAACKCCFDRLVDYIFNTLIQKFLGEVRYQHKVADKNKRLRKRNRKAFRMNLPVKQ